MYMQEIAKIEIKELDIDGMSFRMIYFLPTELPIFQEDPCIECGQGVKDSAPSHCTYCGVGPFCVQHIQFHLYARMTSGEGCPKVRKL